MSPHRSADVYHRILRRHAAQQPSKIFVRDDARSLTYLEVEQATNHLAVQLADLGVEKGATVLVMKPSGIDYVLLWFAVMKLGAIFVPMNDSYRGNILVHQANDSEARLMVVHGDLVDRLEAVADRLQHLQHLVLVGASEEQAAIARRTWKTSDFAALQGFSDTAVDAGVEPWDPMAIFYTSGTTGPSKGVLYSHGQAHATALPFANELSSADIFYMTNPMFHVALPHLVGAVLIPGATIVVRGRFSIEAFWSDIRRYGATVTLLLGTIPSYIASRPATPDDRDHPLRKVLMVPVLPDINDFRLRFGVEVMTWFNMTEVSTPLHSQGYRLANPQSCGRPRDGVDARIVDAQDMPVPPGSVGELIIRTARPWELNLGYWKNPEATAAAWRNLWLHTGDLFRQDEAGNFYFVDRLKDAIRRRGENVSSYEVEAEVLAHPSVHECAAVAAPSEHGEDEIKIVVSLKPGCSLAPDALLDFLQPRMPYFMVPRFVEIQAEELAKTPTGKIRKVELRGAGITGSWDREAAGYVVRR
ncbi:MAG TPA: AMP-binding protein [Sphingobium sp.]